MADEPETTNDVIPDLKIGQLFKHHVKDWLVIILLLIIDIGLNIIHPYRRYVGRYNIDSVRFPHKQNTIPVWSVPIYAVLLPILIFIGYFFRRRSVRDLHHAILGIVTTDWSHYRCRQGWGWASSARLLLEVYTVDTWEVMCSGGGAVLREGYKSFPSGHTAWSFAGLGYLSFYLAGKVVIFDRRGFTWRLSLVVLPLLAAALVAVSRVDDYWHHWQDVTVGGLLAGYPFPHIHRVVSVPLASQDSQQGSQLTTHSTRPRVNGGSYDGRANGGSYDLENGRM